MKTSSNGNVFGVTGSFVREIHRSPVNFPHKGQWCGTLMFSLICAWINGCVNNCEAGDWRRHHGHYDVTVMHFIHICFQWLTHSSPLTHYCWAWLSTVALTKRTTYRKMSPYPRTICKLLLRLWVTLIGIIKVRHGYACGVSVLVAPPSISGCTTAVCHIYLRGPS